MATNHATVYRMSLRELVEAAGYGVAWTVVTRIVILNEMCG